MEATDNPPVHPTLLLADDSVTIQRVIELTFADENITVVAVGGGDEAIAALDRSTPDIVLADSAMPGRSGYDVARHIKSTPTLSHIPVLLLTGAFEHVDQARVAEAGCAGVLTKPFDPQVVVRRVRELLALEAEAIENVVAVSNGKTREPDGDAFAAHADVEAVADPAAAADALAVEPVMIEPVMIEPALVAGAVVESEAVETAVVAASPAKTAPSLDAYFEELDRAIAARAAAEPTRDVPLSSPAAGAAETLTREEQPLIADAFAALLAAEETEGADPLAAMQQFVAPPAPAAPVVTEEMIEAMVGRVLERMTGDTVRQLVTDLASAAAERLVREEIERIKSHIK